MAAIHGLAGGLNFAANLLIVIGYVLVPVFWLPYLPLTRPVLYSGVVFFVTCAMTHLAMAFGFVHNPWMVFNHVVQAVAVLLFVTGFSRLLRRANHTRDMGRRMNGGDPDEPARRAT